MLTKMKIAILTYPLHSNFGFLMQAYALQTFLRKLGHDPYTINIVPQKTPFKNKIKQTIKDIINTLKGVPGCRCFRYWPSEEQQSYMDKNTWDFLNRNLKLTYRLDEFKDLYKFNVEDYDAFIVGSDQVWRNAYLDQITSFYFDFVPNHIKRMSYAASFGISYLDYPKKEKEICKELLQKFDIVTVRETDGVQICKDEYGLEAKKVLDPVFLLTKSDYEYLAEKGKKLSNKKYLFHYLLDPTPEKMAFIENLASENDYDIVNIMPGSFHLLGPKHIEELVYPSVYDMLSGFYHADYVVTDSFHGSAFSIILNKNFTVFANKKRGNSRLTSILSTFGLEDRIYNSGYNYMESIDYEKVNAVISEQRKRSEFIINSFLED